jgi:hypothetical protein
MRSEQDDKVADQMRRCAKVTSVTELLSEADDTLEYLKSHNGIVDQPINDDENIVEDAVHVQSDVGASSSSAVATAPNMPIQDVNDSATKRTHNNTVPLGHKVHPSKVPKMNPQGNLNTFNGMSAQGAQVHMANAHVNEPPMDTTNPFAPLGQNVVGYNVIRQYVA